jgi:cytochrome c oxidase accessory protein FixG
LAIHPADVKGRFLRWRRVLFFFLILFYVGAPLATIGGHPALHLDIEHRRFYLLGWTYNAQDFWLVLLLALSFAFALLFTTAWRGRAWCGWACPQTVFLEGMFRPIERLLDGPRERRLRREGSKRTARDVARSTLKHALYLAMASAIAHVSLSLVLSARELTGMVLEGPAAHPVAFAWSVVVTAILYGNFAWFREQFCVVLCPYGRMQSVLHDRDSIIVGYDVARGEPRGHLKKADAPAAPKTGDCIDCNRCVVVCPTAIDIRNGLQMDCIACAQCVDACDEVMVKVGKPKGLIRYDSSNALERRPSRVLRPRLVLYGLLFVAAFGSLSVALARRVPFESNVMRMGGVPWVLEEDTVRNQYQVHLINKLPDTATFALSVHAPEGVVVRLGQESVELASLEGTSVPLILIAPRTLLHGSLAVELDIAEPHSGQRTQQVVMMVGPPAGAEHHGEEHGRE